MHIEISSSQVANILVQYFSSIFKWKDKTNPHKGRLRLQHFKKSGNSNASQSLRENDS